MNHRLVVSSALASVLALGLVGTAGRLARRTARTRKSATASPRPARTTAPTSSGTHSCAGQTKVDNDAGDWKYVAKGTCKDMKGLTADEAKAKMAMKK